MLQLRHVEQWIPRRLLDILYWESKCSVADILPRPRQWRWLDFELEFLNPRYPADSTSDVAVAMRWMTKKLRRKLLNVMVMEDNARARRWMNRHPDVKRVYEEYCHTTKSTGIQSNDYIRLYLMVRFLKPRYVLECGTGLSTTALGKGLVDNEREHGVKGVCISMEDVPEWYEHAKKLLPGELNDHVQITHSKRVVREHEGCRGVCYESVPEYSYDMMFIDGPTEIDPVSGVKLFDIDAVDVARCNPQMIGLIDHRLNTIRFLRQLLYATHSVIFHPVHDLGYIIPAEFGGGQVA